MARRASIPILAAGAAERDIVEFIGPRLRRARGERSQVRFVALPMKVVLQSFKQIKTIK